MRTTRHGHPMRESLVETILGAVVLFGGLFFLWFALANGADGSTGGDRYDVTARFNNVSGIARGSDVRLSGVKIGVVKSITSDFERYEAVVTMAIDEGAPLPDDTDARISTDGLLGGAYIALEPGASLDYVATDGTGEIIYTRGSVDLLTLFASFASGSGGEGEASSASTGGYPE